MSYSAVLFICRSKFVRAAHGRDDYIRFFNKKRFDELDDIDKRKHSIYKCEECANYKAFALKKSNKPFVNMMWPERTNFLPIIFDEREHVTEHVPVDRPVPVPVPAPIVSTDDIPMHLKRQLAEDFKKENAKKTQQGDMERLFGTDMSQRSYREQRMMVIGEYRDNPPKGHTGNLKLYQFDRETVMRALAENADENRNLKDNMTRKWAALAVDARLQHRYNKEASLNATQVCYQNKFGLNSGFRRVNRAEMVIECRITIHFAISNIWQLPK